MLGAHKSALPASKLEEARAHRINSLKLFTDDIERSLNPTPYKVSVSEASFALLTELRLDLTPIGEPRINENSLLAPCFWPPAGVARLGPMDTEHTH